MLNISNNMFKTYEEHSKRPLLKNCIIWCIFWSFTNKLKYDYIDNNRLHSGWSFINSINNYEQIDMDVVNGKKWNR